jgi:hypothetical protein
MWHLNKINILFKKKSLFFLMEIIHAFEMEVYMKLFTVKNLYIPMHFVTFLYEKCHSVSVVTLLG